MRKIFNTVCWLVLLASLALAVFDLVPGSRYLNLTIVLSAFFAIASTKTAKKVQTVYLVDADDHVVILSDRDTAEEWAKETGIKVIAVPLDMVFDRPENKK